MTKKEIEILDDQIQYLCNHYQDRIKIMRQTLGINTDFSFTRESEIIEYLYEQVLDLRKKLDTPFITASTSGWTVDYIREKRKYKKGEKTPTLLIFPYRFEDFKPDTLTAVSRRLTTQGVSFPFFVLITLTIQRYGFYLVCQNFYHKYSNKSEHSFLNLRSAFSLICRTRSFVNEKSVPMSSNVLGVPVIP